VIPQIIAIDIDSTIIEIMQPWLNIYNHRTGENAKISDVTQFGIHHIFTKLPKDEIYYIFEELDYDKMELFDNVLQTIQKLQASGHKICFHTNVLEHGSATKKLIMLQKFFGKSGYDYVVGNRNGGKLKYLTGANVIIEDCIENCEFGIKHGIMTIMYKRPWNKSYENPQQNFYRCASWIEIESVFRNLGFIQE
jgi:5'(3')-deoxyribonucleotidase